MATVDELITQFRLRMPGQDRGWLLRQVEGAPEPAALAFLLGVLADRAEEDYLRVEVLKGLRARRSSDEPERDLIATAITRVLLADDDDVVRQHAAMALVNYIESQDVVPTLEDIVSRELEDENLRYCALDSLEANVSRPECRDALMRLVTAPGLGSGIRRKLEG